jgi:hypothetical protein
LHYSNIYINGKIDSGGEETLAHQSINTVTPLTIGMIESIAYNDLYPFDGEIEEVAIWDKVLTYDQVQELYRKGVSRLNMDIYSCSDAACTTKTSTVTLNKVPNNEWIAISGLTNTQYFGYDTYFTYPTEFTSNVASDLWKGAYFNDVNFEYEERVPPVTTASFNDTARTLTLTCTDSQTSCASTHKKCGTETSFSEYSEPFVPVGISCQYYSVDTMGNTESPKTINTLYPKASYQCSMVGLIQVSLVFVLLVSMLAIVMKKDELDPTAVIALIGTMLFIIIALLVLSSVMGCVA